MFQDWSLEEHQQHGCIEKSTLKMLMSGLTNVATATSGCEIYWGGLGTMASRTCAVLLLIPGPLCSPFAVWQCLCLYVTYTLQSLMVWYSWFTLNIRKQVTTMRRKKKKNLPHAKWGFYAFIDTIMWIYNEIKRYFSWRYVLISLFGHTIFFNQVVYLISQWNQL